MTHQPNENLTTVSNSQFLEKLTDTWKKRKKFLNQINHNIQRLSIQEKIKFGQIGAVAIAISGSLTGIAIGDYWQNKFNAERIMIRRERQLLTDLRNDAIKLQGLANFPTSLHNPKNFQQAQKTNIQRITRSKSIINQLNNTTSSNQSLQYLFDRYQDSYLLFLKNLEILLKKNSAQSLDKKQIFQIKEEFNKLLESEDRQENQDFINQLVNTIGITTKQEEKIENKLDKVGILRIIFILFSISISITLAYLFIIYISRKIAHPVNAIANVTQQVVKKQDLSLQIPVGNTYELMILGTSLNQILEQLKILSEAQKKSETSTDAANQAKSKFLANMSHELRTPLNGILGYAQILARSANLTEEQRHGVKTIYQCGFHLLGLINDILDLSKLESQKIELQNTDFHFPSFLQGVVEVCRVRAERKGIDFVYEPPPNLPVGITSDKKRLRQVLINLLSNAIKFTNSGCVKLQITASNSQEPSNAIIHFTIVDTGVGMTRQQMENIFLPFEQVENSNHQSEGTGLGLTISQKIVEVMGSQIQVRSQLGVGSLFEFELDCRVAEDWTEASTITSHGKIIGYSGVRKKILIVDEYWENRSLFISLLEPLDFTIIEASNGREGIDKANKYRPDLIISDITMPVVDGWKMLAKIRQSELLKNTIVILATCNIRQIEHRNTGNVTANAFLTRPVQVEELYNLLAKYLQISWIYASPAITADDEITVETSEMLIPPVSDLKMLLEYARKGQIKGIKQELEKIARQDEKYHIFVRQLNKYVKNLNIQKIRAFIQENIHI
ncbi:ATP-binding protein [Calothrix sp. UHCC 0171]|uniref:ATP-binding protein n=1 Tax=Calothrix sp. UHCC 0171 TaxID=3110245 RepID=UPI002B1F81F8|nr:ATP-binding protein [Calothrix sp. UHCC 0171]MEA5572271.1 ATP-binding protein [Calothrix sp. UHCC 0171]